MNNFKQLLPLCVLSLVGIAIVLLSTSRYGVGVSPDSVNYISSAKSLAAGDGYLCFDRRPFAEWPPLFPTLLACFQLIGIAPLTAARFVNAIVFGLIIFASGLVIRQHAQSRALALLGALAVLLSSPLLFVSVMAWTEPLFTFLLVLFINQLRGYYSRRRVSDLLLLSVIGAMAAMQRYSGVTIIISGFLAILFCCRQEHPWQKAKDAIFFAVMSGIPLAIWVARNYVLTGTPAGERTPSVLSFSNNLFLAADTVTAWLLPHMIPFVVRLVIVLVFVVLLSIQYLDWRGRWVKRGEESVQKWFAVIFVVFYSLFVVTSSTTYSMDEIGDRFLAPAYVVVMFLVFAGVDRLSANLKLQATSKRAWALLIAVLCSLWLLLPLTRVAKSLLSRMDEGAGVFSTDGWRESALINYLRSQRLKGQIFSNAPEAIYILTDSDARLVPERTVDIQTFKASLAANDRVYFVWFSEVNRAQCYSWPELTSLIKTEELARFQDGGVYLLQ